MGYEADLDYIDRRHTATDRLPAGTDAGAWLLSLPLTDHAVLDRLRSDRTGPRTPDPVEVGEFGGYADMRDN